MFNFDDVQPLEGGFANLLSITYLGRTGQEVLGVGFGALDKGRVTQFSATLKGGSSWFFFDRNWHAFDTIDSKCNSFQIIKASDTLKHQTFVWPLPFACAQPYQQGSGSHGQLFPPY